MSKVHMNKHKKIVFNKTYPKALQLWKPTAPTRHKLEQHLHLRSAANDFSKKRDPHVMSQQKYTKKKIVVLY